MCIDCGIRNTAPSCMLCHLLYAAKLFINPVRVECLSCFPKGTDTRVHYLSRGSIKKNYTMSTVIKKYKYCIDVHPHSIIACKPKLFCKQSYTLCFYLITEKTSHICFRSKVMGCYDSLCVCGKSRN